MSARAWHSIIPIRVSVPDCERIAEDTTTVKGDPCNLRAHYIRHVCVGIVSAQVVTNASSVYTPYNVTGNGRTTSADGVPYEGEFGQAVVQRCSI